MQGDLISRSAAIQALQKAKELASEPPTRFDIYIHKTFDLCIRLIAAFNAVDVAPVVRCKDCCYLAKNGESLYCTYHDNINVTEEFFCATGEVKHADARKLV